MESAPEVWEAAGDLMMPPVCCFRGLGFLILALMLALILACSGDSSDSGELQEGQVRGRVLEVVGRNLAEVETLRIRDESGKEWAFSAAQGFIGFSPSHIREHQIAGESLLITYVVQDGQLIALDIID